MRHLRLSSIAVVISVFMAEASIAQRASNEFYPSGEEWSINVPKAQPPVAWSDYEAIEKPEAGVERERAELLLRQADQLKREKEFASAEELYLKALEADPQLVQARYQLACNYALWGKKQKASEVFKLAFEEGFADYSFSRDDDELGAIRAEPEFKTRLKTIRERYLSELSKHVGTPVYAEPMDKSNPPLIILLHGYGDSNENYFHFFEEWTDGGFLVVAMPGSLPRLGGEGFTWSTDSVEVTRDQLVEVLEAGSLKGKFDPKKVYLLGFSQGAMHAMQVAMMSPDRFHGVVAISPGGRPWSRGKNYLLDPPSTKHKIWFVHGEQESLDPAIKQWAGECRKAGWSVEITEHDGGHHFPADWESLQPRIAKFLLK